MASAYSLLLFGGTIDVHHTGSAITVNKWIKLHSPARIAVCLTVVLLFI